MFSQLKALFAGSPTSPRGLQELNDIVTGVMLSRFRSLRITSQLDSPPSAIKGAEEVMKGLTAQKFKDMIERVSTDCEDELSGSSLYLHRTALQMTLESQTSLIFAKIYDSNLTSVPQKALHTSLGYTLHTQTSLIPNAGNGLFVKGFVGMGAVLAFIPGSVHLREFLTKPEAMVQFAKDDNHNVYSRYDDIIIDARTYYGKKHELNPLALGHYANHPSSNNVPTALQLMYDFPSTLEPDFHELVPHDFARNPTMLGTVDKSAMCNGLVLVAVRDLEDEEVTVNYRFQPGSKGVPEWYESCDLEGDKKRWDDSKF